MSAAQRKFTRPAKHPAWLRALLVFAVLAAGFLGMGFIASLRQEPAKSEREEIIVRARGIVVERQDYPTVLTGFGTARAPRTTSLRAEVGGRVVETRENLETGVIVQEGELLVRIDPTDYEIALAQAKAEVANATAEVERTKAEKKNNERRAEIARRQLELARREYDRIRELVQGSGAESEARLDQAEMDVARQEDALANIERSLELYPANLQAAEARLEAARAAVDSAETNLERTAILAPFSGRVVMDEVEVGEYVAPNTPVVGLADDGMLEVMVSMDGEEVSRWLNLRRDPSGGSWLLPDRKAPVEVRWAGDPDRVRASGHVARVARFDETTRTFDLVLEIPRIGNSGNDFPLLEGMFVEASVGGRTAENVIVIPREAVDSQGNVLVSENGLLRTVPVEVVRYQQDEALVASGLEEGDVLLTSRPATVLDGTKLDVTLDNEEALRSLEG